ncbi:MAG: repeat-containing protein [Planctomycetaceae bacterium]|nr:repeat-containing protein [Planctomycetaceae bacterium]
MSDSSNAAQDPARQVLFEQALAEYLRLDEQGQPFDRLAFLAAHADLADDLRLFFRNHDSICPMTDPPKAAEAPTIIGKSGTDRVQSGTTVRYFGDYELLAEIARGGMGVVYKARQINLNRIVALKMILAGQLADDSDVKRFQAEAEAAARLDHPGIVPIFEIGQHEGQHYFSMAYVEGESLARKVANGPLPPREAAEMVRKVAEAVEYAHQKGIIHRDLKPANVLLDQAGEPRVTDFGLAKQLKADSNLTGTGQILGTPSYMPPEQAGGHVDQAGPRSDVYALGAILYCLLTGRPPFQAANPVDTLLQVLEAEPVAPRQLNPRLPRDLETICLKCLRKEPEKRYRSAAEFAEDLRRFVNHAPIVARPVGAVERTLKWARRRPALAALIVVGLTGFGGVTWQLQVANREWTRAERLLDESQTQLYINGIELADREWVADHIDRADVTLEACEQRRRGWEWDYLNQLCHPELVTIKTIADVQDLAFSRDGRLLAIPDPGRNRVEFFDSSTGFPAGTSAEHKYQPVTARFSDDGAWLLSGGGAFGRGQQQGELRLQRLNGDHITLDLPGHKAPVVSVAFHPDNVQFASVDNTGVIKIWRAPQGTEVQSLQVSSGIGHTYCLAFDRQGQRLAASGTATAVYVWELGHYEKTSQFEGLEFGITDVAFSPDGRLLAAGDFQSTVIIWDVATRAIRHRIVDAGRKVRFNHDGTELATADYPGKTIRIRDVAHGRLLRQLRGGFNCLDYSPDGKRIASTSIGETVKIRDATQAPEARLLDTRMRFNPHVVAFNPSGRMIVLPDDSEDFWEEGVSPDGGWYRRSGNRKVLSVWNAETGARTMVVRTEVPDLWVRGVTFSRDDSWFATVQSSNGRSTDPPCKVIVRDSKTGAEKLTIERPPQDRLQSLVASPDGSRLAFGGYNQLVEVVHTSDGTKALEIPVRGLHLAYSPKGDLLATTSWVDDLDGRVELWDAISGRPVRTLLVSKFGRGTGMGDVAFSPDSRHLAAAGRNGTVNFVCVWDLSSGKQEHELLGHANVIEALAFNGDGTRLVSGSKDESLIVWDTTVGRRVLTLPGAVGEIYDVAFSPDQRRLAAIGIRGVQLWDSGPPIRVTNTTK